MHNPLNSAVLRNFGQVALWPRRADKIVAVCGEIASDVRLAPILVGLGVDELSMTSSAIPEVRVALSRWSHEDLTAIAEKISRLKTVAEVEQACIDVQTQHGF